MNATWTVTRSLAGYYGKPDLYALIIDDVPVVEVLVTPSSSGRPYLGVKTSPAGPLPDLRSSADVLAELSSLCDFDVPACTFGGVA